MVAPHALKWRGAIEHKHGRSVAHKTLKVWRALWNVTLGMKVAPAGPLKGYPQSQSQAASSAVV
jgi:hypothetical protein